jgi:hypothetical protein
VAWIRFKDDVLGLRRQLGESTAKELLFWLVTSFNLDLWIVCGHYCHVIIAWPIKYLVGLSDKALSLRILFRRVEHRVAELSKSHLRHITPFCIIKRKPIRCLKVLNWSIPHDQTWRHFKIWSICSLHEALLIIWGVRVESRVVVESSVLF